MAGWKKIPLPEIVFEPASMFDNSGRVFRWRGRVYRAIRAESAGFYRGLFEKYNIQELFDYGLVRTGIAPLSLEGYSLILNHDRIPIISYCVEWGAEMLRDAALLICDLTARLHDRGLVLKDVHPWNILFDHGKPVFIDWGSIFPASEVAEWPYLQFRDRLIWPLYLMSAGAFRIARLSMLGPPGSLRLGDVIRLLLKRIPLQALVRFWRSDLELKRRRFRVDADYFQSLRRLLESIPLIEEKTKWDDYDLPYRKLSFRPAEDWPLKARNVYKVLQELRPQSVTDIGCNKGWFSELATLGGASVVAMDTDEPSINALYRGSRTKNLSILPLVMDICYPTPAHGLLQVYPTPETRLSGDLVMALALVHHLVFKRGLSFRVIAAQLAAFTRQCLIVEFIPPGDYWVSKWMNEKFSWYSLDNFISVLREYFPRIEVMDSSPAPRVLLVCDRQESGAMGKALAAGRSKILLKSKIMN
ncbi:MAG: hypothetical protein P9M08_07460 [Candidatus Erginobacter occultus]|nr:hypothetical protein [Candidatus Erginobacter occultus]